MKKQYNFQDWKEFLKANNLTNEKISQITGLKVVTIRSGCMNAKELPTWAVAFIWSWKNCGDIKRLASSFKDFVDAVTKKDE